MEAAKPKKTEDDVEEEEVEKADGEEANDETSDREKDSGPDTDEEEEEQNEKVRFIVGVFFSSIVTIILQTLQNHSTKGGSGDGARKRNIRKE